MPFEEGFYHFLSAYTQELLRITYAKNKYTNKMEIFFIRNEITKHFHKNGPTGCVNLFTSIFCKQSLVLNPMTYLCNISQKCLNVHHVYKFKCKKMN